MGWLLPKRLEIDLFAKVTLAKSGHMEEYLPGLHSCLNYFLYIFRFHVLFVHLDFSHGLILGEDPIHYFSFCGVAVLGG